MSDWVEVKLAELFSSHSPGEWGADPRSDDNDYFVLRSTNFTNDGHVDLSNVVIRNIPKAKHARCRLQDGDILLEKSGGGPDQAVGRVAIFEDENNRRFCCANFVERLCVTKSFDAKFVAFRLLQSYRDGLTIRYEQQTTGIRNLKLRDFLEERVLTPPLPQQRKIARILTTVDNLIEKTEALIAKYQAIKQGMMHDLFTRGVDEHGQLRPAYEEAPELYKPSKLGWIPKEWEVGALGGFLISIDAGWSPDCIEQPPTLGEWGVLKVSAVSSGEYVAAESKTLPNHLHPDKSMEVRAGDVLLARSNGVAELVGVTVRVEETQDKLMLSDKVLRLNPDRKRLSQAFLTLTMKTEPIRRQVGQVINGSSGQRNISQAEIRKLVFVVPSVQEQQIISSRLQSAQSKIQREVNVVAHLQQVKTGLMQDLLTGKVRVKPDDIEEAARV